MGKKSPKPPAAPDPAKTAAAQGTANVEAAIASGILGNVGTQGPGGSTRFDQTGTTLVGGKEVPSFTQITELSESGQQQFDLQEALSLALTQAAQNQAGFLPQDRFTLEGLPFAPGDQDFAQQRGDVERAQFDRTLALLNPQFEEQERGLQENIAQRGIPLSGEDATRQLDRFDASRNQALEQAALASVLSGGQEQNRLFGLQQQVRGQALGERQLERSTPINELAALLQGAPATAQPQGFAPTAAGVAPADVIGSQALSSQIAQQGFQARQQAAQSKNQAIGQIASTGLQLALLSDRRLKRNVKPIMKIAGIMQYSWSYLWDNVTRYGPMAQDVLKVKPEAVFEINGYLAIDFARL